MQGNIDAVVVGVGSGGTLTGIGRFMAKNSPKTRMILADPVGSVLAPLVETGRCQKREAGQLRESARILCRPTPISSSCTRPMRSPIRTALPPRATFLRHEGVLAGIFDRDFARRGAALLPRARASRSGWSAWCATPVQNISPRFSTRSTPPRRAGTRSATARCAMSSSSRFPEGEEVVVHPDDHTAHRLRAHARRRSSRNLPVVDGERIVGLVDESDMLGAVLEALFACVRASGEGGDGDAARNDFRRRADPRPRSAVPPRSRRHRPRRRPFSWHRHAPRSHQLFSYCANEMN